MTHYVIATLKTVPPDLLPELEAEVKSWAKEGNIEIDSIVQVDSSKNCNNIGVRVASSPSKMLEEAFIASLTYQFMPARYSLSNPF